MSAETSESEDADTALQHGRVAPDVECPSSSLASSHRTQHSCLAPTHHSRSRPLRFVALFRLRVPGSVANFFLAFAVSHCIAVLVSLSSTSTISLSRTLFASAINRSKVRGACIWFVPFGCFFAELAESCFSVLLYFFLSLFFLLCFFG